MTPLPAAVPSPTAAALTQNPAETEGVLGLSLPISQSLNLCQKLLSLLQFPCYQVLDPGQLPRVGGRGWGFLSLELEGAGRGSVPLRQDLLQGGAAALLCGCQLLGCLGGVGGPFVWFSQGRERLLARSAEGWMRSESALRRLPASWATDLSRSTRKLSAQEVGSSGEGSSSWIRSKVSIPSEVEVEATAIRCPLVGGRRECWIFALSRVGWAR